MSMAAGTRLSDLPDELLQRILYFVPAKEAASTAVLARRWRSLLPTPWCGAAVHLNNLSYQRAKNSGDDDYSFHIRRRAAILQVAEAALAGHESVSTLTIRLEEKGNNEISTFMSRDDDGRAILDDVLSNPACRRVEVFRIEAYRSAIPVAGSKYHSSSSMPESYVGCYDDELSFGSVPSESLRELHITNCNNLASPPPTSFFPHLAVLRLQSCSVPLDSLQDMVMASPQLDYLHLDYVYIATKTEDSHAHDYYVDNGYVVYTGSVPVTYRDGLQSLCCPTVTTVFLDNCYYASRCVIEIDAPMVRHFRNRGYINSFPLKSPPPPCLTRVDLHIVPGFCSFDTRTLCTLFWNSVRNYRSTKVLKLKLMCPIEDIAVSDKEKHDELIGEMLFDNLEHLELDVKHNTETKDAATAIGNLLQCCPAVTDLRIKLNTANGQSYYSSRKRNALLDFHNSINHFLRRKDPAALFAGGSDNYEVSGIPGLSDKWFNFNCLQFYLKRVSLQFRADKYNCFAVQLAKFFSERAMVLDELCIDDGNKKMCDHMNRKFGGHTGHPFHPCSEYKVLPGVSQEIGMKQFCSFRNRERLANNPKLEIRRTNSWSTGLTILPLER